MFSLINPDGSVRGRLPLTLDETRSLYVDMVEARTYDHKSMAMQKQGRLATYAPFEGQEAAQIGSAAALQEEDWVVGTYRDAALMWRAGYPWDLLFAGRTGNELGGMAPQDVNVLPPSITVGGHMIHAVGLSWAEKLQESDRIALTSFGDGATSEGDFHEAMNFAGVYQTPTVFLCQNNGFAISYPREEQTRSESIAMKADAYGMPGVQVDGNDVAAVYEVTKEAATRARGGDGPTLIEAVTYRLGPHTTADDPTRYRDEDQTEAWRERDPLERVRLLLEMAEGWTAEWQAELENAATQKIESAVDVAETLSAPTPAEMIGRMFDQPTQPLLRQLDEASE